MVCSSYFSMDGFSFFHSSTTFLRLCTLYCSAGGIGMLVLPLFNSFTDYLYSASTHQRLSWRFVHRFGQWKVSLCSFFYSPMAFMVFVPYCSADGSALLVLPLVISFDDGLRTILLSGRLWIAHSSSCWWISWFVHCVALWMTLYWSYFCSSMVFMVWAPHCSTDSSVLLLLPFVNCSNDGLHSVLHCGWMCNVHYSVCQQIHILHTVLLWE